MQENLDNYQLARDRARRNNPRVPPRATQSQEVLGAKRANNEKRSYAQVVKTRSQPADASTVRARMVVEPTGNQNTDDLNARNTAANPYLEHIAIRDARGTHRTPSPVSPVNHVPPAPEGLAPTTAVHATAAISSDAGPIAITSQGRNAWPGITFRQNVGEVVRSRFAGMGRTTRGPRNIHAATNVAQPLRRTDVDTIVPGTPRPDPPLTHGLSLSQPAPNVHIAAHGPTNDAPCAAIHPQTSLDRVTLSQPPPPPTMSPPGPRVRMQRPPRNVEPASQSNSSGSAPIVTPTPTPGGGMTATSTTHNQVQGNTVRAQTVHTAFNFNAADLSSNAGVPVRYKLQATRKSNSQPRRHVPLSVQQAAVSPGSNPFYVPPSRQAPFDQSARAAPLTLLPALPAPPMADRPMITAQNQPLAHRNAEPSAQLARFAASAVPPAQSQVIGAQPPPIPARPPVLLQPQTQAPQYVEYALLHPPVTQYQPAPQLTHAQPFSAAQPQVDQLVAPHFSSQPFGVQVAPATQPLQQQPAGQQAYAHHAPPLVAPAPPHPQAFPQIPLGQAPPMEVEGLDDGQDEQVAAANAVGVGLPGAGLNLAVFRPSIISSYPHEIQPVLRTFVSLYRVWNFATGSYDYKSTNPNDHTPSRDEMALQCWQRANAKHSTVIPFDPEFIKAADAAVCALCSVSKSYLVPLVHHFYGFRVGDPEFNKALKESALPDRFHCGQFEEQRKAMESEIIPEAIRIIAFQSTNSLGFRYPEHFGPINERLFAFVCTLIYHIIYCYRHGDYQHENLCAPQQQGTFAYYMRVIEIFRLRRPNRLHNMKVKAYDYSMRSLVDPDPEPEAEEEEEEHRDMSPDAEEIVTSQYASHFTAPVPPAPVAPVPEAPFAAPTQLRPAVPADSLPVGHMSVSPSGEPSFEIVAHADGSIFLVGPDKTAQIDPALVDDLLNLRISPPHVLEIAAQGASSPTLETMAGGGIHDGYDGALAAASPFDDSSRAGPSGLTAAEKEAVAAAGRRDSDEIDEVEVPLSTRDKGKSKVSSLYGGRYLDESGGVEPCEVEPYVETELPDYSEPVLISDEEMELEQDH